MGPASTVGTRLREARERRGTSLRELAERTRISVMALEALERNDIKRLPGGIFTRSFVRAYASEVGLDPDVTVQDFLAQFPHESLVAGRRGAQIEDNEAIESSRRVAETVVRLVLLSVPLAGLILYFGIRQAPNPTTPAPVSPARRTAPVELVSPPPKPAESIAVQQPAADLERPTPVVSRPVESTGVSDALMMVIEPQSDCWLSLTVDGQKVPSELLASGERRELKATREIVVTVGDAAACAYTLNGAAGRPLGSRGQVVTRRISVDNYRTYLAQ